MQARQKNQLIFYAYLRVQSSLFGQIAPVAARHVAHILAIPGDATAIRSNNVQDHTHGGGFARAVRTKEAEDGTFSDLHRQVFDDMQLTKRLVDRIDNQSHYNN